MFPELTTQCHILKLVLNCALDTTRLILFRRMRGRGDQIEVPYGRIVIYQIPKFRYTATHRDVPGGPKLNQIATI